MSPQVCLSPENELAIKNKDLDWICKTKFADGSGDMADRDYDYLTNLILRGGNIYLVTYMLGNNTFYRFTCTIPIMI